MKKRALIVDDSVVYRTAITQALDGIPDVEVGKVASNGEIALEYLKHGNFDLIILDLEMPVMDGMTAIKEIRKLNKEIKIIVFSAVSEQAAGKTIEALTNGANDFVKKIQGTGNIDESVRMIQTELLPKIQALFETQIEHRKMGENFTKPVNASDDRPIKKPDIVLIGSSTGGPDALMKIIPRLKATLRTPIMIVQHMPPFFTLQLANALNNVSQLNVVEAKKGEPITAGNVYIAPGDYHMTIKRDDKNLSVDLNQNDKVCFVRPSVDVLFQSASEMNGLRFLSVVLTGMGEDGKMGARKLFGKGQQIIIQNRESCMVWGMPKAIYDENTYSRNYDLEQIVSLLNEVCVG